MTKTTPSSSSSSSSNKNKKIRRTFPHKKDHTKSLLRNADCDPASPRRSTVAIFPVYDARHCHRLQKSRVGTTGAADETEIERHQRQCHGVAWADQSEAGCSQEETDQFFQCLAVFCHPSFSQWWFELECNYLNSKLRTYRADLRAICRANHICVERKDCFAVPWSLLTSSLPATALAITIGSCSPFDSLQPCETTA